MLLNGDTQATLFHTRSILNDENAAAANAADESLSEEAAADVSEAEGNASDVEIPDFLAGDGIEIYD